MVPVWVKLPHLPIHCWNDEDFQAIGNTLGKYIDKSEPKAPMFSCARICVEVDLEKGLLEAINISIEGWNHLQTVGYEQIPFKCKYCLEYGHFAKPCPKKPKKPNSEDNHEEIWNVASRKKSVKSSMTPQPHVLAKNTTGNKFEALANEDAEIEIPEENEEEATPQEQEIPVEAPSPKQMDPRAEDLPHPVARNEGVVIFEGSITRFRDKESSKET